MEFYRPTSPKVFLAIAIFLSLLTLQLTSKTNSILTPTQTVPCPTDNYDPQALALKPDETMQDFGVILKYGYISCHATASYNLAYDIIMSAYILIMILFLSTFSRAFSLLSMEH